MKRKENGRERENTRKEKKKKGGGRERENARNGIFQERESVKLTIGE